MQKSIVLFNTNSHTRNFHITQMIYAAASRKVGAENVHLAQYDTLAPLCRAHPGSILLCVDGQRVPHALIAAARPYTQACVLWQFDDPYNQDGNVANASLFDHVFTNEPTSVAAYGGSASFLPLAGDVSPKPIPSDADKECDVFFCGSAWPNRVVQLNRLLALRPRLNWRICLTYNPHLPGLPLELPESAYLRSLSFGDMLETAARARITLDLNRVFGGSDSGDEALSATYPGPRIFELAGRGAFQLSVNTPGLRRVFDKTEVPSGTTEMSIVQELDHWLENPEKRAAMALRAQEKITQKHTYDHRLDVILEQCGKISAAKPKSVNVPAKSRKSLLFVVHNVLGDSNFGGLELHQDAVARYLAKDYDIYFMWSYRIEARRVIVILDRNYEEIGVSTTNVSDTSSMLQNAQFEKSFSQALETLKIDLVHFFHFREAPPSLAQIATSLDVPYSVSLHDYYLILRNFTLTNGDGVYLEEKINNFNELERILSKSIKIPMGGYASRHAAFGRVLKNAASVIYISNASREIFEKSFPELRNHPSTRVHHAPIPSTNYKIFRNLASPRRLTSSPNYVVLGNMAPHKGGPYLIQALESMPEFNGKLHFHGSMEEGIKRQISKTIGDRAVFHGRYAPGSLDLTAYDFSLHLSTWPEVYCQTLSEAWAMGVIPIVTDIGALGERVQHMKNGLKVDYRNPSSLGVLFDFIQKSPETFEPLRNIDTKGLFMDPPVAAAQYSTAFAEIFTRNNSAPKAALSSGQPTSVTIEMLGRNSRWNSWTETSRSQTSEPVRPRGVRTQNVRNVPASRVRVLKKLRGNLDQLTVIPDARVKWPSDTTKTLDPEANVFADDVLQAQGWFRFDTAPANMPGTQPVVMLSKEGGSEWLVFEAMREDRQDLLDTFGEHAKHWGITAKFDIADARHLVSGRFSVRVGLMTPDGTITAHSSSQTLVGHLRRRSRIGA